MTSPTDVKSPSRGTLRDAFGVNVHLKKFEPEMIERMVELVCQLGAGRVRLVLDWYKP